jgi:cellulose synthase/poly-beta-1,6-N-acetylglucosamine synthase-like glycosyltransferase
MNYFKQYADAVRPGKIKPILASIFPKEEPTEFGNDFICLLIAGHNEELVLGNTIQSAINAGMDAENIYVVDDFSDDNTSAVAKSILPASNVHRVHRSGKGLAISKAAKKFNLTKRYQWIHIADADGAFAPNYFEVLKQNIDPDSAAVTGYIRSLPGKRVSEFRAFEYTVGMELHRRIQSMFGVIPIIPGPTSCFRSDVFGKLDFANKALTEDFDVTLQIYRRQLGTIQFIPQAVAYTQDPLTTKVFVKQITRWNRGVMQGMTRHKIGKKMSPIDAYLTYQVGQGLLLFLNTFVWIPYVVYSRGATGTAFLATTFVMDVALTYVISLLAAIRSGRWDMLSAFPIIYAYKWISLGVFIKSFIEVMILRKFRITEGSWDSGGSKRYRIAA